MASMSCEIGCMYYGLIRDLVGEMKFEGQNIEHWEGRGWISRRFVFRGDPAPIQRLARTLEQIDKHNRALDAAQKTS